MIDTPVRVGLVGCGAVTQLYYTPALKELERVGLIRVSALFDPSEASIAVLKQNFPHADRIGDLSTFSRHLLDLAIVASPPQYHAVQTIQLLKAGLSVLCEKPMANTVAEAQAMIEAADQAQGVLAIGLFRRFFPAAQAIRQLLSLGMLGEVQSFECDEGGYFSWPVQSPAYFQRSTARGGVLLDLGVHQLDLLLWWFGEPIKIQYEDDAMGGIEANCRLQFHYEGFTGTSRLSRDCDLANRYLIKGSKGWLSWTVNEADNIQLGFANSDLALDTKLHYTDRRSTLPMLAHPAFNFEQSFTQQICNLIEAMRGKESLVVPAAEGIRSLRWIEHCYQNRSLMAMPWLSSSEVNRARQLSVSCE